MQTKHSVMPIGHGGSGSGVAERRRVTLKDVGHRANVSPALVSAVLRGETDVVRVSEATRARVLETARQMEYRPNALARSLRSRRTNIVGLYSSAGYLDMRLTFFADIVGGLHEACHRHGKDLLLHSGHGRFVEDIYAELTDGRIDGLVIYAEVSDPLVTRLAGSHLPVVAVVDAVPELPSVVVDEAEGSRLLAEYVIRRGHRRVLYRATEHPRASPTRRQAAFYGAGAADLRIHEWRAQHVADVEGVRRALRWDLPPDQRPTVAVCWNDLSAYDLLGHCRTLGVRVPQDLAVLGFDDIPPPPGAGITRRLTTVRAPWAEVTRTAVKLLVAHVETGEPVPAETVLPVSLVTGDTA